MYHISNDKRAKRSADAIVSGLISIAKVTPLPDITVSDLLRKTNLSRSTFYRLFDNVIDILEYECDSITQDIFITDGDLKTFHVERFFTNLIDSLMAHDLFLEILIRSHRMDIFCISFRKNLSSINVYLNDQNPVDTATTDYLNYIIAAVLLSTISTWVQHEKTESKYQVYANLKTSIQALSDLLYS